MLVKRKIAYTIVFPNLGWRFTENILFFQATIVGQAKDILWFISYMCFIEGSFLKSYVSSFEGCGIYELYKIFTKFERTG